MSVTAAAEHLGVVPSTAHRLLAALCARGFAIQDRDRRYRAGPELAAMLGSGVNQGALRKAARPALEWLTDAVGETSHLMILNGPNIEFIDGVEARTVLKIAARIGDQMPAYCSAGGKALLAALGDDEVDTVYHNGLTPWRTARITDVAALKSHLEGVRTIGYGVNTGETESGVCGIGMCVHGSDRRPVAALTIAVPSPRFDPHNLGRLAQTLHEAVAMIEEKLRSQ